MKKKKSGSCVIFPGRTPSPNTGLRVWDGLRYDVEPAEPADSGKGLSETALLVSTEDTGTDCRATKSARMSARVLSISSDRACRSCIHWVHIRDVAVNITGHFAKNFDGCDGSFDRCAWN